MNIREAQGAQWKPTWCGVDAMRKSGVLGQGQALRQGSYSQPREPPTSWGRPWTPSCSLTGSQPQCQLLGQIPPKAQDRAWRKGDAH